LGLEDIGINELGVVLFEARFEDSDEAALSTLA
jgi:hypothetical protein